jgi:hypothetical protein
MIPDRDCSFPYTPCSYYFGQRPCRRLWLVVLTKVTVFLVFVSTSPEIPVLHPVRWRNATTSRATPVHSRALHYHRYPAKDLGMFPPHSLAPHCLDGPAHVPAPTIYVYIPASPELHARDIFIFAVQPSHISQCAWRHLFPTTDSRLEYGHHASLSYQSCRACLQCRET